VSGKFRTYSFGKEKRFIHWELWEGCVALIWGIREHIVKSLWLKLCCQNFLSEFVRGEMGLKKKAL
jgi:hypothetical protein